MAEYRKPTISLLLKKEGKKKQSKVELFKRELFTQEPMPSRHVKQKYRLRVNGVWYPKGEKRYFASWEIKEMFWDSLSI